MNLRLKILASFLILGYCAIVARLFYWQIIKATDLSQIAAGQYQQGVVTQAPRGDIFASDGSYLSAKGESWLVYAEPPKVKESAKRIAEKLAPFFLEDDPDRPALLLEIDRIEQLLLRHASVWVILKSRVDSDTKRNIESLGIGGIGFERQEKRIYPESSVAAQLLGFVGKDSDGRDQGYFGLEGYYDLILSGRPGFVSREFDAKGIPILTGDAKEVTAVDGVDLVTYIDKTVQISVDQKLLAGIEKYGAKGGSVVVANPATGAILAMSSYPSYDPANYSKYSDELFKNPVISDSFEPGSVFKVVVMAAGIDSGSITPETICDICSGPLKIDKYYIETWNKKYSPDSTMTDVIVHSDNVGMSFVAQKIGSDMLYDYLDKFGFGKLTDIDLQGEASPALRKKETWNEVDLATASFGQGIAITPIQLVQAVSAIANKGLMPAPRVVKEIKNDTWSKNSDSPQAKRVISEKTASQVTQMMVEAAKYGESKWTNVSGFSVAGKTGTAQIPISGHYDSEKTIASFIGFAPAEDPKFIMLVTLKEPQSSQWASETAAPLWYSIAKDLFLHFGIQPEG